MVIEDSLPPFLGLEHHYTIVAAIVGFKYHYTIIVV
jgi:hypothetical protein